ncbi:MAG: NAD-dependent epimerase/dehydratase family protein [Bacteroidota bacterium]|nr:NAD-dependent epimerase/dehydratase family protein [Bacteroidota bacterium]
MVIGHGMVAKRFASYKENDDFVIFASGVSNSKNTDLNAYARESVLLQTTLEKHKDKTLVYFSTCSIYDKGESGSPYVIHKIKMETYIRENAAHYYIFRVSNLVGRSDNHNTILNFFKYHITNKINFDLWNQSMRNLIDTDDMFSITDHILQNHLYPNQVINVANPVSYPVTDIVTSLESLLGVKANYISIPKGSQFTIDIGLILPIIRELQIAFGNQYMASLIKKYYL